MNDYQIKVYLLLTFLFFISLYNIGNPVSYASILLILIVLYRSGGVFVGSSWKGAKTSRIHKIVKEVQGCKVVYDIGSGDGRLVIAAAPYVSFVYGLEIDPAKCLFSTIKIKAKGIKNAKILFGNFFTKDISNADAVILYLPQETVDRLQNKLKSLRKGTRIVAYVSRCKELKLVKEIKEDKIYVYRV